MKNKKKEETSLLVLRNDVYQSNPLVNSRKVFDLLGMKIFLLGLRGLNPHFSERDKYYDKEFPALFIPTSKLTEIFGNTKYLAELKPACKKLFDTIIELNSADGGFTLYHLFDELKYKPNDGLYLQFSRYMRPYILDLFQTKGYTRINVEYLFKLSSPYAVRLLELLLQYQNIKLFKELMEIKRKMTIEEIRFALNVPEGTYNNRMDHFRKFVLDDPIKEINTRTPYIVRYDVIKEGRKVVAFEFTMDTYNVPKDEEDICQSKSSSEAIKALCCLGFKERDARAIFAKCQDTPDCFSRINRAEAVLARNKKPVENKLGFLREAIENDWQVGRKTNRETTKSKGIRLENKITNSRQVSREKEETKAVDSFDDSMTPIGEIVKPTLSKILNERPLEKSKPVKEKPPEKPRYIKIGRKEMPYILAETFIKYIKKGEFLDAVKTELKDYKTSIEQFTEICAKNGLH